MKLSEMRRVLNAESIQLTKSLGQNFLHDSQKIQQIVAAADLLPTEPVLEIGPGLGPLTAALIAHGNPVLAIEKDRRLFEVLKRRFTEASNLTLLHADALDWVRNDIPQGAPEPLAATAQPAGDARPNLTLWKVVSNLPYSVASPLLIELAKRADRPARLVVTLQAEVVDRILSAAGNPHYGVLSLLLQARYSSHGTFRIASGCFFPEPDVESACITLIRRDPPLLSLEQERLFDRLVKTSFSQRRKMMRKLLKLSWPASLLDQAWADLKWSPQVRAERISLDGFVQLTQWLWNHKHPETMKSSTS